MLAGLAAGTLATAAQMLLWWLSATPVLETLLRDARLAAAIVMGPAALAPPATGHWGILSVATLVHFALSFAYAVPAALFAGRLRAKPLVVAGALYGLVIYGVNLYGFTAVFPWFVVVRGWVTALTHVVFGITLVGVAWLLVSDRGTGAPSGASNTGT